MTQKLEAGIFQFLNSACSSQGECPQRSATDQRQSQTLKGATFSAIYDVVFICGNTPGVPEKGGCHAATGKMSENFGVSGLKSVVLLTRNN
jgi:hypothetical protein